MHEAKKTGFISGVLKQLPGCCRVSDPDLSENCLKLHIVEKCLSYIRQTEAALFSVSAWSIQHFDSWYSFTDFPRLSPLSPLSQNNLLHCVAGLLLMAESTTVIKTSVCVCVNGESALTGSAALSVRIMEQQSCGVTPPAWATAWENEIPEAGAHVNRRRGFSSVMMANYHSRLKFKHDAQIPGGALFVLRLAEGYSLMAPERVPMARSCREGLKLSALGWWGNPCSTVWGGERGQTGGGWDGDVTAETMTGWRREAETLCR